MGRLFGTDGARGIANTELSCELAMKIGRAAAYVLTRNTENKAKILIGKDTRVSSDMLEAALVAGICSVGADAILLGVVPTPAVAYLVKKYSADAAVMISASHNPVQYNGIKLFNDVGLKLSDEIEEEIEKFVLDIPQEIPLKVGTDVGCCTRWKSAVEDYIDHLFDSVDANMKGLRVAIDCANGSASVTAKQLFDRLGAESVIINASPDGGNINYNCGSTHMNALQTLVLDGQYDLGVAFDGDADRCLAITSDGEEVDGDRIIAILAGYLKEKGKLHKDTAVVTILSNMGFFEFAENNKIKAKTTKVGDRYVLECMLEEGYNLGGEQSGHIILSDFASTGDGQLSAAMLMKVMAEKKRSLRELADCMVKYPQVCSNITVSKEGRQKYEGNKDIENFVKKCEKELDGDGRIIVRPSGTEPLIRVMLEGKNYSQIEDICQRITKMLRERLG